MFRNFLLITMKPDKSHHILNDFYHFTDCYILMQSVDGKKLKLLCFVQLQLQKHLIARKRLGIFTCFYPGP